MENKRKIQEINAGSMADIAFLLLVFFIVATTMSTDRGITRILPPMPDETQQATDVKKRNVLEIFVSRFDEIMVNKKKIDVLQLREEAKKFILNVTNDPDLPEKETKNIDLIGEYAVSKGVISLKNDRATTYKVYIKVQNELVRAFREVRDDFSMLKFGKNFSDLSDEQREAIVKAIPLAISESEPNKTEGGN